MSLNLVGFVKSLLPSFSKSDIESDLEISLEHIPLIIESYTSFQNVQDIAKLQHKQSKDLVTAFYKELNAADSKLKLSHTKALGHDTVTLFTNIKVNGEYLLKEIGDAVNDVVMSQALTAYKLNLLRSIPHYYFMVRYATDLLNFLYVKEVEHSNIETERSFRLNKKQEEFITKNTWIYARLVAFYGMDHNKFKSKVESISEVTVPQDKVEDIVDQFADDKLDVFNSLPQGFVGSPIYSVRLIFAQWEADRYRSMKDKKKLLELRYLHLKLLKEQGTSDANLDTEITYLQERISDLDYKLSKIEEDVNV